MILDQLKPVGLGADSEHCLHDSLHHIASPLQVTVQVPGAGTGRLCMPPGTSVADLLEADTAGAKVADGGGLLACTMYAGARMLRGGTTLKEAGGNRRRPARGAADGSGGDALVRHRVGRVTVGV